MNYWLMKTEGECYGIDDLKRDKKTVWTGVRNYQARNFMMKMEVGDLVLFYHSSSNPTGVYGIAKVIGNAHPDDTQFDKKDEHHDPKSIKAKPIWYCADIAFVEKFTKPVSLHTLKIDPNVRGMMVIQRGSRLSVQPVSEKHFNYIREHMTKM